MMISEPLILVMLLLSYDGPAWEPGSFFLDVGLDYRPARFRVRGGPGGPLQGEAEYARKEPAAYREEGEDYVTVAGCQRACRDRGDLQRRSFVRHCLQYRPNRALRRRAV
jgi:hypothetical protein